MLLLLTPTQYWQKSSTPSVWVAGCVVISLNEVPAGNISFSFRTFPYELYSISAQNDYWTEIALDKTQRINIFSNSNAPVKTRDRSIAQLAKVSIDPYLN